MKVLSAAVSNSRVVVGTSFALFLVLLFAYLYQTSPDNVSVDKSTPDSSRHLVGALDVPQGWKTYVDDGLGYRFAYPSDWSLNIETSNTIQQQRSEKIALMKGNVRILIDPLGRLGADESGGSQLTKERALLGGVDWLHTQDGNYHRYVDDGGVLVLKEDPSTNGIYSIGGRTETYSHRGNFRVHVYLDDEPLQLTRSETLDTAVEILKTITVLGYE